MSDLSPAMLQTLFRGLAVKQIVPLTNDEEHKCIRLQRRGLTLREISAALNCDHRAVVKYLYWDVVRNR